MSLYDDAEPPRGFHEDEDSGHIKVNNLKALDWFAKEGGWDDAQQFLDEHNIKFNELKGKWFTALRGQIFFKDEPKKSYKDKFENIKDQMKDEQEWRARMKKK